MHACIDSFIADRLLTAHTHTVSADRLLQADAYSHTLLLHLALLRLLPSDHLAGRGDMSRTTHAYEQGGAHIYINLAYILLPSEPTPLRATVNGTRTLLLVSPTPFRA